MAKKKDIVEEVALEVPTTEQVAEVVEAVLNQPTVEREDPGNSSRAYRQ
mgnify:CR=1 FL=1